MTVSNSLYDDEFIKVDLDNIFSTAYDKNYSELSYSNDNLESIIVWENSNKNNRIFEIDETILELCSGIMFWNLYCNRARLGSIRIIGRRFYF